MAIYFDPSERQVLHLQNSTFKPPLVSLPPSFALEIAPLASQNSPTEALSPEPLPCPPGSQNIQAWSCPSPTQAFSLSTTSSWVPWEEAQCPSLPAWGQQQVAGCEGVAGTCDGQGVPRKSFRQPVPAPEQNAEKGSMCPVNIYRTGVSEQEAYGHH